MSENSDFNDLAKATKGLKSVKAQVQNVVDAAKGTPFPPFIVKPHGVYLFGKEGDDGQPEEKVMCSYLMPVGITTNPSGSDYAVMFEIKNPEGRLKKITIRMEETQSRGGETARIIFVKNGGTFAPGDRSKTLFNDFLNAVMRSAKNLPRITTTPASGWLTINNTRLFITPKAGITPRVEGGKS